MYVIVIMYNGANLIALYNDKYICVDITGTVNCMHTPGIHFTHESKGQSWHELLLCSLLLNSITS